MSYYYAIGPVPKSTDDGGDYYHAPVGSVGWIDTRPIVPTEENGFFAFHYYPSELESTHAIIGDGNRLEEYYPTAIERSAWETLYGVSVNPSWTLLECLRQMFFVQADPEGLTLCKPGMPTHNGYLELHLGGHSRVLKQRFTGKAHDAWPALQKLQQVEFARLIAEQAAQADAIRKAKAGSELGKRIAERAAGRKDGASFGDVQEELAKAAEAVPSKVLADAAKLFKCDAADLLPKGVELAIRKPETSVSDDFNRGDGAIGANWTARDGTWTVSSNEALGDSDAVTALLSYTVHATALSSSNNYGQAKATYFSGTTAYWGVVARANTSNYTLYAFIARSQETTGKRLRKLNAAGSLTDFWTSDSISATGHTYKVQADGSSISCYDNGAEITTQTDSAVSAGLYVGMCTHPSIGSMRADDFAGGDMVVPSGGSIPGPLMMLRVS